MEPLEIQLPNHKRSVDYILLALISVNLMTNAAGSYVLPFYPPLAFHQAHMDYSIIGMLMSCKSIGALIAAYVFGSKIQVWGRKKWLLITLFAQAVIMLLYATLYYITEYYYLFLGTSIMIRLMEGIMRSIQSVVTMAYIAIFYSSTFGQKFSLMESMASFGQILGPVLGSLFHYYFGYCVPLLGLFGLLIACLCFCQQAIPSDNNLPQMKAEHQKPSLPIWQALTHQSVAIIFAALVVSRAAVIFFNSFFTNHMASYDMQEDFAAIMMSVPQVSYTILILVCSRLFTNKEQYRLIFSVSLLMNFIGTAIISPVWSVTADIHHIWIGLIFVALGGALNRLPSIPVLSRTIEDTMLQTSSPQELIDMASALLQMTLAASNLLFPSIGGLLYQLFGGESDQKEEEKQAFRLTMMTLVICQLAMFFVDLLFNGGSRAWRQFLHSRKQEHNPLQQTSDNLSLDNLSSDNLSKSQITTSTDLEEL